MWAGNWYIGTGGGDVTYNLLVEGLSVEVEALPDVTVQAEISVTVDNTDIVVALDQSIDVTVGS